jgi:type I restriction enzyme S subunit
MNLTAQSLKDEFLGRVCLKTDPEPALLNQRIARFINLGVDDVRPFLFVYFKSPSFRSYVNRLDTGSLIRHMHSKQLLAHRFPLPPIEEQREIARRVGTIFKLADAIEKRVQAATARAEKLTQSILAKAFRGELVPTEAELARRDGRTYEPASALLGRIKSEENSPVTAKQLSFSLQTRAIRKKRRAMVR